MAALVGARVRAVAAVDTRRRPARVRLGLVGLVGAVPAAARLARRVLLATPVRTRVVPGLAGVTTPARAIPVRSIRAVGPVARRAATIRVASSTAVVPAEWARWAAIPAVVAAAVATAAVVAAGPVPAAGAVALARAVPRAPSPVAGLAALGAVGPVLVPGPVLAWALPRKASSAALVLVARVVGPVPAWAVWAGVVAVAARTRSTRLPVTWSTRKTAT